MTVEIDQTELLIGAHLLVVPYLFIGPRYDPALLMNEVLLLRESFRDHRANAGWRTLALRAYRGNAEYTEAEHVYGRGPGQFIDFEWTPIAESVPAIVECVSRVVNTSRATRIRVMELRPGATVKCHKDSDRSIALVAHFPLSYRAGCKFEIDLLPSGKRWSGSKQIPFGNNRAALVNIGRYHTVVNRSGSSRFAIIAEGPTILSAKELLSLAEEQNGTKGLVICHRALEHNLAHIQAAKSGPGG